METHGGNDFARAGLCSCITAGSSRNEAVSHAGKAIDLTFLKRIDLKFQGLREQQYRSNMPHHSCSHHFSQSARRETQGSPS